MKVSGTGCRKHHHVTVGPSLTVTRSLFYLVSPAPSTHSFCELHWCQCVQHGSAWTLVVVHNLCITLVSVCSTWVSLDPCGCSQLVNYTGISAFNMGQLGPLWLFTTCALHWYQCAQLGSAQTPNSKHWFTTSFLQPLLYCYAIGPRKLSAN